MQKQLIVKKIILFLILLTPLFSIGELISLLQNLSVAQLENTTPTYVKAIKDLLIILVILISIDLNRFVNNAYLFTLLYFLIVSLVISSFFISYLVLLSGIRWSYSLFLILFLYKYVDKDLQYSISRLLNKLFILFFIMQIIEFFVINKFGINNSGYSLRNPGFFLIPSTGAFFIIVVIYYRDNFHSKPMHFFQRLVFYLSIYLTASGTGIVALIAYEISRILVKNNAKIIILILPLLFIPMLFILPMILSRPELMISLLTRIEVFFSQLSIIKLFLSNDFGAGTNTGVLLMNSLSISDGNVIVADSTFTSILVNMGLSSLIVFICFLISNLYKNAKGTLFIVIYMCFMLSTIIFEVFPMNILFSINMVWILKSNKNERVKNALIASS